MGEKKEREREERGGIKLLWKERKGEKLLRREREEREREREKMRDGNRNVVKRLNGKT
jgi:hypothetical protein